ncbi:peptidylprolyl isomerase [Arenibacterium halophilum]|uniref:Parvulin-like PPIase n=1 Tax=Arenibacterium halophilum TaxID=2583821 RepID=A0ABY2XCZ3_9RHOB|nr:peptidylprolyl isomerase [Arenibacterium halophilum]TMV14462.1 peptidylprolyl isomerase [Arenibacterium halophilum]
MAARAKNLSRTFVWIIVGLLIIGLAGFGATNLGGNIRTIGKVGDQPITIDAYARELQREMQAFEAQTGQAMTVARARELGLDRAVLARLVQLAALDDETQRLGISSGDENLQREIVQIPAFQGIDGKFDRETYRFALDRANMKETEFEEDLRAESARTLVQAAVTSGVVMPPVLTNLLIDFVGARRSFTYATLSPDTLEEPLAEPTEEELQAFYDENPDMFRLAETRRITYVALTPEQVIDSVEVDDAAIQRLFEDRAAEYQLPDRRLVERLVYGNEEAASEAKAQLEVGGTTFETLVADRGLDLADIDMGDVTTADLGAAAEAVFAAEEGEVVGPLQTDLGPALFRINGILAARDTPIDDVRDELRDELAAEQARRQIEARAEPIEDMLAGGATLEDVAKETEMTLGQLDWTPDNGEGIAAYAAFDDTAAQVTESDFPEIAFLDDGGIFALRLDEILPERPQPFDDAREAVATAWTDAKTREALAARAEALSAEVTEAGDFESTGLPVNVENGLMRSAYIDATPPNFMEQVFQMEVGETRVIEGETDVFLVRLDATDAPEDSDDIRRTREALSNQMDQALAQALFAAFARDAQLRAGARIDEQALNAVLAGFN